MIRGALLAALALLVLGCGGEPPPPQPSAAAPPDADPPPEADDDAVANQAAPASDEREARKDTLRALGVGGAVDRLDQQNDERNQQLEELAEE